MGKAPNCYGSKSADGAYGPLLAGNTMKPASVNRPAGQVPPASSDWSRVILVLATGMVASFPIGKVPPALPQIQEELSLTLFMAGWVISSFNILSVLSASAAGSVADWWGHRRMIIFGLMSQVIGSLVGALAESPSLLLATRVAEGIGFICVAVSGPVLILQATRPQDRRLAMGVWGTFMPAGAALIMILSPWLLNNLGWRGMWFVNAGLVLVFTGFFIFFSRGLTNTGSGEKLNLSQFYRDIRSVVLAGQPALFGLCFLCFAMMFLAMMGFLPTMLLSSGQVSPRYAAWMTALVLGMNVIGNIVAGLLMKRGIERHWMLTMGYISMALCSLGIYEPGLNLGLRYVLCLLFAGIGGIVPATVIEGAVTSAPSPSLVGTSQGLLMQGSQVGHLVGPPVLAAVVSGFGGWSAAPWFMITCSSAGMVLTWLVWRTSR